MIGNWLFHQFMRLQIYLYRRSGGKTMGKLRGIPLLLLTTTGRKTGAQRVLPLMFIRDGDNYVITAANGGSDKNPDWYWNLKANPQATIVVGSLTSKVAARQASAEEKAILWPQLVAQAPFFDDYRKKTSRDIPMVILQPSRAEHAASVGRVDSTIQIK